MPERVLRVLWSGAEAKSLGGAGMALACGGDAGRELDSTAESTQPFIGELIATAAEDDAP